MGPLGLVCAVLLATAIPVARAAGADAWRGRSVYQVVTDRFATTDGSTPECDPMAEQYCGGTWQGLIKNLDYIHDMGFSAVWISPVVYQINGTKNGAGYHGYWAQDLYGVNPNFGQPSDLTALSNALHDRGMYLMVDVTPNNLAYEGTASQIDYSILNPLNQQSYFHTPCLVDYNNQTSIEQCSQSVNANALPDAATENEAVASILNTWISSLVSNYSIDGLRLDATNHMSKDFLASFQTAAGVFIAGEVYQDDPSYACSYQGSQAINAITNYPMYFPLVRAFNATTTSDPTDTRMATLASMIGFLKDFNEDTSLLGLFTENQDQPCFGSWTTDMSLLRNALTFQFLSDSFPILYYGQEQLYQGGNQPADREALWSSGYSTDAPLYKHIALLNQIRYKISTVSDSGFLTSQQGVLYNDTSVIALSKGSNGTQMVAVLNNQGEGGGAYNLRIGNTGLSGGTGVTEILGCTTQNLESDGALDVGMEDGQPKVYYRTDGLEGTGLCGH